eukprot:jgi/Tetstr1/435891/TSEL_024778.t2
MVDGAREAAGSAAGPSGPTATEQQRQAGGASSSGAPAGGDANDADAGEFSFLPQPKPKVPLTANATVVDRSGETASRSMPPPPPVLNSAGRRIMNGQRARPPSAGYRRQKVPLAEHGMTQLEFLQSKKDMSGLNGGPRRRGISKAEVAEHKTPEDAWVILRGKVYNLTPYLPFHPGGQKILMATAGKDCTALFDRYHRWVNSDFLLKNCLIGLVE